MLLIGLTLTACALPGAGPSSFMSTMHPTQEFCASRGMTLDMGAKECGKTPQPAAALQAPSAESATGSLPQATTQPQSTSLSPAASPASTEPVPSTAQQNQRTSLSVTVEADAKIFADLQHDFDLMYEFAHFVRASGYRCDSISALAPHPVSHGYELVCNRFAYKYGIEHKNGRWIVTLE
jgi:hypothetical protein